LYLGSASVGLFSALAYVPILGGLIINAISQSALPLLSDEFRFARPAYWRRLSLLVAFGFALGATGLALSVTAGEQVLALAYTAEYASHADLLVWLVLAASISYAFIFLGTGATARHRFHAQLTISVLSTAALLAVAGPFIRAHGLRGAALAMVVAALVDSVGYLILTAYDYVRSPTAKVTPVFAP
jgi:O-antigen/teichoic acid export membrane protein